MIKRYNILQAAPRQPAVQLLSYDNRSDTVINEKKCALSQNIINVRQSITSPQENLAPPLKINDGKNILRSEICTLLLTASDSCDETLQNKLSALVHTLQAHSESALLNSDEKESLLHNLYALRKESPASLNKDISRAIKYLEKLIYSCFLSDKFDFADKEHKEDIAFLSNPGATKSKSATVNLQGAGRIPLVSKLISLRAYGKVSYTRTHKSDIDDEGIPGRDKESKYAAALGVEARKTMPSGFDLHASAEISAYKKKSHGINYSSARDAIREKISTKTFTYKRLHKLDRLMVKKHSIIYHQKKAQNNQNLFNESWEKITNKKIESISPAPFQPATKTKRSGGSGYIAQVNANANFTSFANAGAKVQYEYAKNNIEVDVHINMLDTILKNKNDNSRIKDLNALAAYFEKAFIFTSKDNNIIQDGKVRSNLTVDEIHTLATSLGNMIDNYSSTVRLHDRGDSSATKRKHQLEKSCNVKTSGRYGFLQSAEVILANLASRLQDHDNQNNVESDTLALIKRINNKIINPTFSYDKQKLVPLISFNNIIAINNSSHTVSAEFEGSLANDVIKGGGKISIALTNKRVNNPYRIRAGDQRDVEITLTGHVTLTNALSQITEKLSEEAGIPIEMLQDSVTDIFNSSLDLSAGVKVILRYFSPDWSRNNAKQPHYTHQVTYVQALKEANVSQNVNLPTTAVEISTGLSGGVKKTSILSQKMGTDTLNYLMLRYNYLADRKDEQSTWNNFINENKKNIMILMNNMSDTGKNSAHELNFILNEKIQSTDPSNHAGINEQFESIMENIRAVKEDKDKFDSALKGIEKLMDWHREETSRLSQSKLKPVEFSLPKNKFSSKLHF